MERSIIWVVFWRVAFVWWSKADLVWESFVKPSCISLSLKRSPSKWEQASVQTLKFAIAREGIIRHFVSYKAISQIIMKVQVLELDHNLKERPHEAIDLTINSSLWNSYHKKSFGLSNKIVRIILHQLLLSPQNC